MSSISREYLVKFAGICGSDINKAQEASFEVDDILALGHEIVCASDAGELYVVNPFECNGYCERCAQDSYMHCDKVTRIGAGKVNGGYAGKICINPSNLYRIPAFVEHPEIGVLCDGIAVILHGFHMVDLCGVRNVAIIGTGSIGILSALVAKDRYPEMVIDIVCRSSQKKAFLSQIFKDKFNFIDADSISQKKCRYDLVIEAVGGKQTKTLSDAVDIVKNSGTILVFGAFNNDCKTFDNLRQLFYKQISLLGVNSFCQKYNDFQDAVDWAITHEDIILPLLTDLFYVKREMINSKELYQSVVQRKLLKGCFVYE